MSVAKAQAKRKEPGHSGLTTLISSYKASAKRRGLDFTLTREIVKALTQQDCHS